jgi:Anabaena sensory rhodopsin transducer
MPEDEPRFAQRRRPVLARYDLPIGCADAECDCAHQHPALRWGWIGDFLQAGRAAPSRQDSDCAQDRHHCSVRRTAATPGARGIRPNRRKVPRASILVGTRLADRALRRCARSGNGRNGTPAMGNPGGLHSLRKQVLRPRPGLPRNRVNAGDRDAKVAITIYFADREPVGPYKVSVGARRTLHLRFNDLSDPQPMPRDTDYASVFESDLSSSSIPDWIPAAPNSRCCRRWPMRKADRQAPGPHGPPAGCGIMMELFYPGAIEQVRPRETPADPSSFPRWTLPRQTAAETIALIVSPRSLVSSCPLVSSPASPGNPGDIEVTDSPDERCT